MTGALAGALLLYLEASLLVTVGLIVSRALRRSSERGWLRLDRVGSMQLGRTIFVVALLAPFVAHVIVAAWPAWMFDVATPAPVREMPATTSPADPLAGSVWGIHWLEQDTSGGGGWLTPERVELGVAVASATLVAGVLIALAVMALGLLRLRRLVRAAVPVRRRGSLHIVVSDRIEVPFSTAVFGSAWVVLPVALLRHPADVRIVLRHELQHYRHGDQRWTIGCELFRLLFFWHPAAYAWVRDLMNLQELACDEALVRRGTPVRDYGDCLIRVAASAVERRMVASTAMASSSERGPILARRIDMLFDHGETRVSLRTRKLACTLGTLVVLASAQIAAWNWPRAADLTVDDTSAAVNDVETFDESVDLFRRDAVSSLKLELDGDCATVVVQGANEDCVTDLAHAEHCNAMSETTASTGTPLSMEALELEFSNPDGSTIRLGQLEGKVTLIDFWASWCPPCATELQHLKALDREFGGEDFEIVGVSLSRSREEFEAFVTDHDVPWPQLHAEEGWRSAAARAFDVKALPSHILIDRDGRYTQVPLGDPGALTAAVRGLIAER